MPARDAVLSIVGLSLDVAFSRLCPDQPTERRARLVDAYKDAFASLRTQNKEMGPLYPGAREALELFRAQDHTFLAVATGKSRRGLYKVLERHRLQGVFHSEQVADYHPSKPHPSMILTAMAETGITSEAAIMVGDTTFDMDMARAAGIKKIGVSWGYHPANALFPDALIHNFADLPETVDDLMGQAP